MDSLGAKLSNNSLIPPRQGSNWLGRRLRSLARACRTVVGVDGGSLYSMRKAVGLFRGYEGGMVWGVALRTPNTPWP